MGEIDEIEPGDFGCFFVDLFWIYLTPLSYGPKVCAGWCTEPVPSSIAWMCLK